MNCKFCNQRTDATGAICFRCAEIIKMFRPLISARLLSARDSAHRGFISEDEVEYAVETTDQLLMELCRTNPLR